MGAFTAAFVQFFTAITSLFSAFNRVAVAADNIGKVAEYSSGTYADEAYIKQRKQRISLDKELADLEASIASGTYKPAVVEANKPPLLS